MQYQSPNLTPQSSPGLAPQKSASDSTYVYGSSGHSSVVTAHAARTAAQNCSYFLPRLLSLAKTNPHLRVLDVGCGPGSITLDFARLLPATAKVIGLDLSQELVNRATKAAADAGVNNVRFVQGDAFSLSSLDFNLFATSALGSDGSKSDAVEESGKFDIVHTHQVMSHLPRPLPVIRELVRMTKPGGLLCIREGILQTRVTAASNRTLEETLNASMDKFTETLALTIGSPSVDETQAPDERRVQAGSLGLHLKTLVHAAGVPYHNITFTLGTICYSSPEERRMWGGVWRSHFTLSSGTLTSSSPAETPSTGNPKENGEEKEASSLWVRKAVSAGIVTDEQVREFRDAWAEWVQDEEGVFGILNGEVVAVVSGSD